jgi:hypothetical protein
MSMAAAGKCRLVPPSVKGWGSSARLAIVIRGDGVAATLARCMFAGLQVMLGECVWYSGGSLGAPLRGLAVEQRMGQT